MSAARRAMQAARDIYMGPDGIVRNEAANEAYQRDKHAAEEPK
jgi:hypothetical protein